MLIEHFSSQYQLGIVSMDTTHQEFVDQVNDLEQVSGEQFVQGFLALVDHTKLHFDYEQKLMHDFAFPTTNEHTEEHHRVLGALDRFARHVENGRHQFAKAYVREALPAWFHLHAKTMDSALAAHLKANRCFSPEVGLPQIPV